MKKTRIYMILMALLLFSGCRSRNDAAAESSGSSTGFLLCHPPARLYGEHVQIRFDSSGKHDTLSVEEMISIRSSRNLMYWSGCSTLEPER